MTEKPEAADAAATRRELFRLLRELDPDSSPTFRGRVVDRAGLVTLAQAASSGDEESQSVLDDIYELAVIEEIADDQKRVELVGIDEAWRSNMQLLPSIVEKLGALAEPLKNESVVRALRGQVLVALLDPNADGQLAARLEKLEHRLPGADDQLQQVLAWLRAENGEPIKRIAATLALEPAIERREHDLAESAAAEEVEQERREAAEDEAREERLRPVRRRDRAIVLSTVALLATVWPPSWLGDLLSRGGPLQDPGALLLRRFGTATPVVTAANWATGSIAILIVASAALCIRTQIRGHRTAAVAFVVFGLAAAGLVLFLPALRDSAWRGDLSRIAKPRDARPCTHSEDAVYTLPNGAAQPVLVGPAPVCQNVARLSTRRGRAAWEKRVPKIHISRIHTFAPLLVVGGTYGGRRTPAGQVVGGHLIVAGVGPRTGRELWRRTCRAPADGEHAIAFSATKNKRYRDGYVRLRCADGRLIRMDPRTGRTH